MSTTEDTDSNMTNMPPKWRYALWWPFRIITWLTGGARDVKVVVGVWRRQDQPLTLCIVRAEGSEGLAMSCLTIGKARSLADSLIKSADFAETFILKKENIDASH